MVQVLIGVFYDSARGGGGAFRIGDLRAAKDSDDDSASNGEVFGDAYGDEKPTA